MNGHFDVGLPRWAVMWALAFAIYAGLKLLSWSFRSSGRTCGWKHAAYLLAWPGMDASVFLFTPASDVVRPRRSEWAAAIGKTGLGLSIFLVAIRMSWTAEAYVVGWAGMVGIVMTLHFGLFDLLSCGWRRCGVQAAPIMNSPVLAGTVSEFWSRRWNMAFRDLTSRFVVRPLRRPLGASGAVAAGFVISGVIHDAVMSIPAGAGLGSPTLYFILQGAAVFAERSAVGRRWGLGRGKTGRVFAWVTVLGLAPLLLLHRPFVECVVAPFIAALGEL